MLWVLWDIFLPIIAAFLVGLLTGWMLWRWRRSRVDAETLGALRRNASRLKVDADNLRIRNAELSDRLQVASGSGQNQDGSAQELARCKKRVEVLSDELKTSRQQIDKLRKDNAASGVNRVRELEAKLQGAQRRITDLERHAASSTVPANHNQPDQTDAIRTRDEMIATLKKSLDQFGANSDITTLEANLELRDRKIAALEKQLEELHRR